MEKEVKAPKETKKAWMAKMERMETRITMAEDLAIDEIKVTLNIVQLTKLNNSAYFKVTPKIF